jgi:hypothetical protein
MAYQIPVGNSEGKKPFQKSRHRCDDDNGIDKPTHPKEMACQDVGWTHVAQDRDQRRAALVDIMSQRVPQRLGIS